MKLLTEKEKKEITEESLETIIDTCKLHGFNFADLEKPVQNAMIHLYQEAINDFTKIKA